MPRSYGPGCTDTVDGSFEADLRDKLRLARTPGNDLYTVDFVDDWDAYHIQEGEIHCGTNSWRLPGISDEKWWTHVLPV